MNMLSLNVVDQSIVGLSNGGLNEQKYIHVQEM